MPFELPKEMIAPPPSDQEINDAEANTPVASFELPKEVVQKDVDHLKLDPSYDPLAAAQGLTEGHPDYEKAFAVHQAREAMSSSERKAAGLELSFGGKAEEAGKGAVKFFAGIPASIAINAGSIAANAPSLAAKAYNAVKPAGAAYVDDEPGRIAKSLQTDAIIANEKAGQGLQSAADSANLDTPFKNRNYIVSRTFDHPLTRDEIDAIKQGSVKKEIDAAKTSQPRDVFSAKVEDFRRNNSLDKGQVIDQGLFADAAKSLGGLTPSEAALTPQQQVALGVNPTGFEKYAVDAAGTAQNPANIAYALAPEVPGVAAGLKMAGKAAGKLATPLAAGAEALPDISWHGVFSHPLRTGISLVATPILKAAPKAAEFVESAGKQMTEGAAEGANPLAIRAKQMLAGSVGGTAIGVATNPDDPEGGALSGFAMGAIGGAASDTHPAQLQGKRAAMEAQGATLRTGNDAVDATHDAITANFSPEARAALNRQRAAMAATGTNLVVTDQAGFNQALAANQQGEANGARGTYQGDDKHILQDNGDGSRTIYLNADAISKGGGDGSTALDTSGHEIGHAVTDYLAKETAHAASDTLLAAVESNLTPEEVAQIQGAYTQALARNTGSGSVVPAETILHENIAEITRKILNEKDISEFGLPQSLSEKLTNSVKDFFGGTCGDSGGMKWGTKDVTKARRIIERALYDIGAKSTEQRQRQRDVAAGKVQPNLAERQQQIASRLSEIGSLQPSKVTPEILRERAKLMKEASDLRAAEQARQAGVDPNQAASTQPTPPVAPTTPTAPAAVPAVNNDRTAVTAALQKLGYNTTTAQQMAAAAQGADIESMIKDALSKKQVAPTVQTAPPASPAPSLATFTLSPAVQPPKPAETAATGQLSSFQTPTATATAAPEAPLANFDPNAQPARTEQPAGASVPQGVPPVAPGHVDLGATPTEPAGGSRPTASPQEVSAALGAATTAAQATPEYQRALKKKAKATTEKNEDALAQADARLETLEKDARLEALKKLLPRHEQGSGVAPDELHVSADNFGNESIKGKIDETNPVHSEIMAHGEMSPEEIARVKQLQEKAGAVSYIDYGSAAKEDNVRRHGEQRRRELAASPAQNRVEGEGEVTEQKNKAVIPVGNTVTASGRVNTVALSPDKILSNLGSVVRAATENGLPNGNFSGRPEVLSNLSIYLRNHRNAYSGDGTVKVDPTIAPNAKGESFVDANGNPVDAETAKARMRVFNMAMHDTRATAPARAEAKQAAYDTAMKAWTDGGEQGPKPRQPRGLDPKTKFDAEAGQALAKRYGEMDEATGETNPLRAALEKAGYDTGKELESPWENLRPELIRDIRDSANGPQEIVRPHRVAPEEIAGAVTNPPSGKATLAGFMPGETEPSIKSKDEKQLSHFMPSEEEEQRFGKGFYSQLERTVEAKLPNRFKAEQAWNTIKNAPGIKSDELEYTNLEHWLKSREGMVTKADLQAYLKRNNVDLHTEGQDAGGPQWIVRDSNGEEFSRHDSEWEAERAAEGVNNEEERNYLNEYGPMISDENVYIVRDADGNSVQEFNDERDAQRYIDRHADEENPLTLDDEGKRYTVYDYEGAPLRSFDDEADAEFYRDRMEERVLNNFNSRYYVEEGEGEGNKFGPGGQYGDNYYTHGGENYREIRHIAAPRKRITKEGNYASGGTFPKDHFEADTTAHTREQDFQTTDGKSARHLDESQSDWNQAARDERKGLVEQVARDKGISEEEANKLVPERYPFDTITKYHAVDKQGNAKGPFLTREEAEQAGEEIKRQNPLYATDPETWVVTRGNNREPVDRNSDEESSSAVTVATPDGQRILNSYDTPKRAYEAALELRNNPPVVKEEQTKPMPEPAFKKTWSEMAFKKALWKAIEDGKDKITWSRGIEHVKRYEHGLRQAVDKITWEKVPGTDNVIIAAEKDGNTSFSETVPLQGKGMVSGKRASLKDVVGKQMTKQIRESSESSGHFEGDDLALGGEGMQGYYDDIYPKMVKKIVEKYGGSVGESKIVTTDGNQRVWSVDITPEMAAKIKEEGLPLFMPGESGKQDDGKQLSSFDAPKDEPSIKSKVEQLAGFMPGDRDATKPDELGFYSGLAKIVSDKIPNRASPDQILATLKSNGAKQEEMDNMGLPEFLKTKQGPVTKQELQDFVKAGGVQLKEVSKGGKDAMARRDEAQELSNLRSMMDDRTARGYKTLADPEDQARMDELEAKFKGQDLYDALSLGGGTKFSQYQIPGGTNYKEVLLTLPERGYDESRFKYLQDRNYDRLLSEPEKAEYVELIKQRKSTKGEQFKSSHWDEPNVLAHIRQADHTDTEGNKVRLIEEIQSDWHQKGRKEGYQEGDPEKQRSELAELRAKYEDAYKDVSTRDFERLNAQVDSDNATDPRFIEANKIRAEVLPRIHELEKKLQSQSVPDAPFKKTWAELAFKRALRMAVEDGMDKIAWTPGEAQAERYDLSKQVSRIEWQGLDSKPGEVLLSVFGTDGDKIMNEWHPVTKLPDIVGKEVAEKIAAEKSGYLSGEGLKVGGEGMKGFYDKILPDFVRKYVKKWGGTVETSELDNGKGKSRIETRRKDAPEGTWYVDSIFTDPEEAEKTLAQRRENYPKGDWRVIHEPSPGTQVHSVAITPEMRKAVMEGQPMFMPGDSGDTANPADRENRPQLTGFNPQAVGQPRTTDLHESQPSIKSKGQLSSFMPSDYSGRGETTVKEREPEPDLSPEAIKKRRIADFVSQGAWLDNEAQKLGYADKNDLNDKDEAKYHELAGQWREEHPRFDTQGRQLFMPGTGEPIDSAEAAGSVDSTGEGAEPRRTWFMRDGKRVYHQRHPSSGQFMPKQTLAKFQPGSVQSDQDEQKQLADFAP